MPQKGIIESIVAGYKKDPARLIDMVRDIQKELGQVSAESAAKIAVLLNISKWMSRAS